MTFNAVNSYANGEGGDALCKALVTSPAFVLSDSAHKLKTLLVGSPNGKEISEIGRDNVRRLSVTCVDILPNTHGKFSKSMRFVESDFFKFRTNDTFDFVACRWFLHHLSDKRSSRFVRRAFELLNPGGRLVIVDWVIRSFTDATDRFAALQEYFTDPDMETLNSKASAKFHQIGSDGYDAYLRENNNRGAKMKSVEMVTDDLRESGFGSIESVNVSKYGRSKTWGHFLITGDKP